MAVSVGFHMSEPFTPKQRRAILIYRTALAMIRPEMTCAVNDRAARDRAVELYCKAQIAGQSPDDAARSASLHSGIHARIIARIVSTNIGA